MKSAHTQDKAPAGTMGLALAATGVVYGDIGTSPLYAFREALHAASEGGAFARADVLGLLSLIFWALMLVVTVKYVTVLLRMDNRGEGGPLALMALVRSVFYGNTRPFLVMGMASMALFLGDAIITPAISVLAAAEGLVVVHAGLEPYILPLATGVIVGLFLMQQRGTAGVSVFFGPIMTAWFLVLAATGVQHIGDAPDVLRALNPWHAAAFLATHGGVAFVTLGAVFLAVTGAEALYADLGHFGKSAMRRAWIWLVFPALALNYFGQGALVLSNPDTADNPFFHMVAPEYLAALVALATAATVIASQAVITGAFSLTRQAINLGLLPRMAVRHTSGTHSGQIYMPQVNYMMMAGVLALVFMFRSSGGLSAAYGISVSGTMVFSGALAFFVAWRLWNWHPAAACLLALPMLAVDSAFLAANLLKIGDGGWVPVLLASVLMAFMGTWIKGTVILNSRSRKRDIRLDAFIRAFSQKHAGVARVPGTAFFLSSDPGVVPASLAQNLRHNRVLHEKNVILSVRVEPIPAVAGNRCILTRLNADFSLLVLRFGFMETPDVQEELIRLNKDRDADISFDWEKTSVFLNRRVLRAHPRYGLPLWQDWIFIWLNRNAADPSDYYRLPTGRVIEIGRHVII